jgi:hypothetical protein
MNTVLPTAATAPGGASGAIDRVRGAIGHLLASWQSVRWVEFGGFLSLGLLYGLVDLTGIADSRRPELMWPLFWRLLLSPSICTLALLLAWLPADRSDPDSRWRSHRIALACLLGALAALPAMHAVAAWFDWPTYEDLCAPKCRAPLVWWQRFLSDFLSVLLPGSLGAALIEMLRRRWRAASQLQTLLDEQALLGRQAMAARLAAMQAQVEPRFLFDVLVDVQQQYAQGSGEQAAEQLERLIHHLRVALPRLRDQNVTTLDAEVALLGSYLALRQALERRPVEFVDQVPAELRACPVPTMLLLPLLQRALRLAPGGVPPGITLAARRGTTRLALGLQVSAPGLCGDDADLAAQRERLRVLAGDTACLRCEADEHRTTFTLELPA